MMLLKNDAYDKLVTKVNAIPLNNIDTSKFVLKTKYDTDKPKLENKILDTSDLVKKTDYNTKITEIEGKIPDISNLATKTALTTVENKIPNVSSLIKKQIITLALLRLILSYQTLVVKLLKIKMSLLKIQVLLYYFSLEMQCLMGRMVIKLI